mmetsp:Transcript_1218/g.1826  ORF Transcript_1218/g.1826 Transcript_1218/m.1826 type:complete len:271 (+) Transcript_1218:116-928(+)|eukprot:CAMPEP_0194256826 /NCGR_PEP_ID=MMETSP0158-20130606/37599_1 /TAXON_ID=33649 /ORGANISM="Thalassionema nitzschioides, Strain L26-B" /LENGTH=270 /DNA_ID=CAMNT_0038995651 /DNA_START=91 /DNA_END=903 /DNA_ORIENTATION=+
MKSRSILFFGIILAFILSQEHVQAKVASVTTTPALSPLRPRTNNVASRTNTISEYPRLTFLSSVFVNQVKKNEKITSSVTAIFGRTKDVINAFLFQRLIDSVFDGADTNNDGRISLSEANTLILRMYVKLNRSAPIPTPPTAKVDALFQNADVDNSGCLSRTEFRKLAMVCLCRASTRLVAHKVVSFAVAPILAIRTVDSLSTIHRDGGNVDWSKVTRWLPKKLQGRITDSNLWKTVLTVVFVKSLGNAVISSVTFVLDRIHLKKNTKEG